jgi:TPR repeat protein
MKKRKMRIWALAITSLFTMALIIASYTLSQHYIEDECYSDNTSYSNNKDQDKSAQQHQEVPQQEQYNAEEHFALANIYIEGSGEKRAEAIQHFTAAATQGHTEAQYKLGVLYEEGRFVAKDIDVAYYWYGRAAQQGHQDALKRLRQNL